jgi:hypothetical protein
VNVFRELYGRIPPLVREVVDGLDADALLHRPGPDANPIGWLVWHLARVQDHQLSELFGAEQLWVTGDWPARFGLDPDPNDLGYGHTSEQVGAVRAGDAGDLLAYLDAVDARTTAWLDDPGDLERVVDESWDPPVTLGVRLVSVADDCLQHVGQAAYIKGLLART